MSLSSFAVPPSTPPAPSSTELDLASPGASSSSHSAGGQSSSAAALLERSAEPSSVSSEEDVNYRLHHHLHHHHRHHLHDRDRQVTAGGGGGEPNDKRGERLPTTTTSNAAVALGMAAVSPPTPAPSPRPSEQVGLNAVTFYSTIEGRSAEESQTAHMLALFNQLPSPARTGLLQALLPLLTTAELLLLSSGISPRLKRDFLQDLPLELALHILSFVDEPRTLARASCVSRFWRRLLEDEWTWKEMCTRHRFAATTVGEGGRTPSPALAIGGDREDDPTTITDDVTMFGSPRLGIDQAPGAPRLPQVGAIASPVAFFSPPPPFVSEPTATATTAGHQTPGGLASAFMSSSASSVARFTDAEEGFGPGGSDSPDDDDDVAPAVAADTASNSSVPLPATANGILPAAPSAELSTAAGQHAFFANGLGSFPSLPDLFRAQAGGSGHSAAAVAVREALEAPSPASFLAYALSSVQASVHAPAGMAGLASQFPFATADEDDSAMSDSEHPSPALSQHGLQAAHNQPRGSSPTTTTLPVSAATAAAAAEAAAAAAASQASGNRTTIGQLPLAPGMSPTRFFASLTNTLGLPYGTPTRATPTQADDQAPPTSSRDPPQMSPVASSRPSAVSTLLDSQQQLQQQGRIFPPRGLGLAPYPARTASIGGRSTSSPLAGSSSFAEDGRQVGSIAAKGKGKGKWKGKAPRRRRSAGGRSSPEAEEDAEEEARFSYKRHFKRAYLTESNWLRGGRLLSTHTSTDDGVVTSLAVDERYIVIGMANCKIHVFDAATGTFLRTLVGHELGVWCLTLISAGGERKSAPPPRSATADDVDMDAAASGGSSRARADPFYRAAAAHSPAPPASSQHAGGRLHRRRRSSASPTMSTPSVGGPVNTPVVIGGTTDVPLGPDGQPQPPPPQGLYAGLTDFSANSQRPAASSTTSLPPSFDDHFRASASRHGRGGRPKVAQSDVCGASKGFGQSRTLIVSGGCDRDVRVWDAETGACLYILRGHTSTIRCLKVLEGRPLVVSGSRDATLRVWDVEKGVLVHLLAGHQHSVRCIEVAGNQVVSGSYDCTCRLWDVDTGECLQIFRGHYHQIYSVAFDGERVATGSLDSTVRVWSAETGDCLALLQGHTSLVGQLQLTNDLLVTGGSDGRVIVFSLSTFECLHRLCAHDNSVTCLQFDDRFVVSGGNDGRVKLWDLRTGAFIRELSKPCEAVWRVSFKDDKCVVLCKRGGKTVMEVLTFRPPEEDI